MKRGDDGVTLIELLVVLSITGVVAAAIAAAFAVGVKTTDTANRRLAGSQGAQIATSFFPSDVRTSKTGPSAAPGSCAAGTSRARFDWSDADAATPPVITAKRAEYCEVTGPTQTDLVREYRENGALVGAPVVVAYKISSASVGCVPDCTTPTSVTLTVLAPDNGDFSVTGRRRMP